MTDIVVSGENNTTVIDDKDTITKTVNKTVNVTKSDNTQIETDLKTIQNDIVKLIAANKRHSNAINRIDKKIDALMTKLEVLPVADIGKEDNDETV